jgi:hypothetical protein
MLEAERRRTMRLDQLYDAPSITARCMEEDILAAAARERVIHEARGITARRAPVAEIGHRLVCLGQWLQATAQHRTYQEETV